MVRVGDNNANTGVSNNSNGSSNLRHVTQSTAASTSSLPSPSSNTRTPRGLIRVRQRMNDEVSLRSTRSSSSRTSSVRGIASSSTAPAHGLPSYPYMEDTQMEIDLDSIGQQRSHPSQYHHYHNQHQHQHHYHSHHAPPTTPATAAAAAGGQAAVLATGQDHMLMEPAGSSSNTTRRPTTRYRTRATQVAISPAPISTSNFGPSSISSSGATGFPEPSSASTASSISDTHSAAPVSFSRFSINLPNPRGGTSISSSLLPIRPDSDDEEQDMSLDPLIDHQPMATDDAETASSIAMSMMDHHYHPPSGAAPRRRDLNPPPELIAEIIHNQFSTHLPSSSNGRPLSTTSSASSSMVAAAPTTTPGVSSSGSSMTSEHRLTMDPYPMTRSRSAQLAAAARASSSHISGPSVSTSGGGNTSSGYQHLQYSSHMSHYGEGSTASYTSGRRPAYESTESSTSTATLRRRTPGTTATVDEPAGPRPIEFLAIVGTGARRSHSNTSTNGSVLSPHGGSSPTAMATPRRRSAEEVSSSSTLPSSSPSSSSSSSSSSSPSTTPNTPTPPTADAAMRAAARERFRQLQNQVPLLSRIIAHVTGSRAAATANLRPGSGSGSGSASASGSGSGGSHHGSSIETDAGLTTSATAGSSTTLAGPLSSPSLLPSSSGSTSASTSSSSLLLPHDSTFSSGTTPGDMHGLSSSSATEGGEAPRRPRRHHHSLRVIQFGSTALGHGHGPASGSGPLGEETNDEHAGDGGEGGRRADYGETVVLVLNALGPLLRMRSSGGEEGEGGAAGTTTPEDGHYDTNGFGGGSTNNNAGNDGSSEDHHHHHHRPRGQPQWLVVTLSSAYLGSVLAGSSLNLDGEGGMNYDELWEFATMMGPARPITTTQEAINQAGFHVGRFEGAIPGMRDYDMLGDAAKCLVCMCEYEEGEDLRALDCKHGFHQECIDKWLTTGANKCPICRAAAVVPVETPAVAAAQE
ncbi:hypothetical protein DFQ27_002138 [Actinomortierella ambigua]|uniref:RING-type domain-containing protein n=1 Tax=Actinomortierella ambigua TaxID=1343610 RepID=A0A9P6U7B9_9FUNG|nr:hypothetical protein DFQ27_002138 [Actinomortierella ambigua]